MFLLDQTVSYTMSVRLSFNVGAVESLEINQEHNGS